MKDMWPELPGIRDTKPPSVPVGRSSSSNRLESVGAQTFERHFKTSKERQRHVGLLRP